MAFPATRLRRLRKTGVLRELVRETRLTSSDLVLPMFVQLGDGRTPVEAMPGVERLSISHAVEEAGQAAALGLPAVLLFGVPAEKDEQASGAHDDEGVVQLAVRALKEAVNRSYETTLREGLLFERRLFHALFATEDQAEGMAAFAEKRRPQFRGK